MGNPGFTVTGSQNRYFRFRPVGENVRFEIYVIELPYTVRFGSLNFLSLYFMRKKVGNSDFKGGWRALESV